MAPPPEQTQEQQLARSYISGLGGLSPEQRTSLLKQSLAPAGVPASNQNKGRQAAANAGNALPLGTPTVTAPGVGSTDNDFRRTPTAPGGATVDYNPQGYSTEWLPGGEKYAEFQKRYAESEQGRDLAAANARLNEQGEAAPRPFELGLQNPYQQGDNFGRAFGEPIPEGEEVDRSREVVHGTYVPPAPKGILTNDKEDWVRGFGLPGGVRKLQPAIQEDRIQSVMEVLREKNETEVSGWKSWIGSTSWLSRNLLRGPGGHVRAKPEILTDEQLRANAVEQVRGGDIGYGEEAFEQVMMEAAELQELLKKDGKAGWQKVREARKRSSGKYTPDRVWGVDLPGTMGLINTQSQFAINQNIKGISKRIDDGVATLDEMLYMRGYMLQKTLESRDKAFLGITAETLSMLPAFATEIFATGGVAAAGRKATRRALAKIGLKGKTPVGRLGRKAVAAVGGEARRLATPVFGEHVAASYAERTTQAEIGDVATGFEGQEMVPAALSATLDMGIELVSERFGGALTGKTYRALGGNKIAGLIKKAMPDNVITGVFKRFSPADKVRALSAGITQMAKKNFSPERWAKWKEKYKGAGLHGPLEELVEERFGDLARMATGLQERDETAFKDMGTFLNQILGEGIAFMAIPASKLGLAAADTALNEAFAKNRARHRALEDDIIRGKEALQAQRDEDWKKRKESGIDLTPEEEDQFQAEHYWDMTPEARLRREADYARGEPDRRERQRRGEAAAKDRDEAARATAEFEVGAMDVAETGYREQDEARERDVRGRARTADELARQKAARSRRAQRRDDISRPGAPPTKPVSVAQPFGDKPGRQTATFKGETDEEAEEAAGRLQAVLTPELVARSRQTGGGEDGRKQRDAAKGVLEQFFTPNQIRNLPKGDFEVSVQAGARPPSDVILGGLGAEVQKPRPFNVVVTPISKDERKRRDDLREYGEGQREGALGRATPQYGVSGTQTPVPEPPAESVPIYGVGREIEPPPAVVRGTVHKGTLADVPGQTSTEDYYTVVHTGEGAEKQADLFKKHVTQGAVATARTPGNPKEWNKLKRFLPGKVVRKLPRYFRVDVEEIIEGAGGYHTRIVPTKGPTDGQEPSPGQGPTPPQAPQVTPPGGAAPLTGEPADAGAAEQAQAGAAPGAGQGLEGVKISGFVKSDQQLRKAQGLDMPGGRSTFAGNIGGVNIEIYRDPETKKWEVFPGTSSVGKFSTSVDVFEGGIGADTKAELLDTLRKMRLRTVLEGARQSAQPAAAVEAGEPADQANLTRIARENDNVVRVRTADGVMHVGKTSGTISRGVSGSGNRLSVGDGNVDLTGATILPPVNTTDIKVGDEVEFVGYAVTAAGGASTTEKATVVKVVDGLPVVNHKGRALKLNSESLVGHTALQEPPSDTQPTEPGPGPTQEQIDAAREDFLRDDDEGEESGRRPLSPSEEKTVAAATVEAPATMAKKEIEKRIRKAEKELPNPAQATETAIENFGWGSESPFDFSGKIPPEVVERLNGEFGPIQWRQAIRANISAGKGEDIIRDLEGMTTDAKITGMDMWIALVQDALQGKGESQAALLRAARRVAESPDDQVKFGAFLTLTEPQPVTSRERVPVTDDFGTQLKTKAGKLRYRWKPKTEKARVIPKIFIRPQLIPEGWTFEINEELMTITEEEVAGTTYRYVASVDDSSVKFIVDALADGIPIDAGTMQSGVKGAIAEGIAEGLEPDEPEDAVGTAQVGTTQGAAPATATPVDAEAEAAADPKREKFIEDVDGLANDSWDSPQIVKSWADKALKNGYISKEEHAEVLRIRKHYMDIARSETERGEEIEHDVSDAWDELKSSLFYEATEPTPTAAQGAPAAIVFSSGLTRSNEEADAAIAEGRPVGVQGVTPQEGKDRSLSQPMRQKLVDYANKGGAVFVDSGAFSTYTGAKKVDWPRVFYAYGELIRMVNTGSLGNVYIVAPDVVGDHAASYKLNEDLSDEFRKFIEYNRESDGVDFTGANVIFPVQKGGEGSHGTIQENFADLTNLYEGMGGPKIIIGVPYNPLLAWSHDDVMKLLRDRDRWGEATRIHLLGGGEAKVNGLLDAASEEGLDVESIGGDSLTKSASARRGTGAAAEGAGLFAQPSQPLTTGQLALPGTEMGEHMMDVPGVNQDSADDQKIRDRYDETATGDLYDPEGDASGPQPGPLVKLTSSLGSAPRGPSVADEVETAEPAETAKPAMTARGAADLLAGRDTGQPGPTKRGPVHPPDDRESWPPIKPIPTVPTEQVEPATVTIERLGRVLNTIIRVSAQPNPEWGDSYWGDSGGITVRFSGDLWAASHATAHALDDKYGIIKKWYQTVPKEVGGVMMKVPVKSHLDEELKEFWYAGSVSNATPLLSKRAEGAAVWIHTWLVNPDLAKKMAPKFHELFESKVPDNIRGDLRMIGDDVRRRAYANEHHPMNVLKSHIAPVQEGRTLYDKLRDQIKDNEELAFNVNFWDKLKEGFVDELSVAIKAWNYARQVRGIEDILPQDNFTDMARRLAGHDRKVEAFIKDGPLNAKGDVVGDWSHGIFDILHLLDPKNLRGDLEDLQAMMVAQRTRGEGESLKETGKNLYKTLQERKEAYILVLDKQDALKSLRQRIKLMGRSKGRGLGEKIQLAKEEATELQNEIRALRVLIRGQTSQVIKLRNRIKVDAPPLKPGPAVDIDKQFQPIQKYLDEKIPRVLGAGAGLISDQDLTEGALAQLRKESSDEKWGRLTAASAKYREYANSIITYLVDKGRLSKEDGDAIIASKAGKDGKSWYIPFQRVLEQEQQKATPNSELDRQSAALAKSTDPIEGFTGGLLPLKNPLESLMVTVNRVVMETDRNEAMRAFVDMMDTERKFHDPDPTKPAIPLDLIASKVRERTQAETGMSSRAWAETNSTKEIGVVSVWRDGKEEFWRMSKDVTDSLNRMNQPEFSPIVRFFAVPAQIQRKMITLSPGFLIRNVIRDAMHRYVVSEVGSMPTDIIDGYTHDEVSEFYAAGGGQFGHYLTSSKQWNQEMNRQIGKLQGDPQSIVGWGLEKVGKWEEIAASSELVNRIAEYRKAKEHAKKDKAKGGLGYDEYNARMYAAARARDLMDFAVAGTIIKPINQMLIFTNARIRGLVRIGESIKRNPGLFAARATAIAFAPAVLEAVWAGVTGTEEELWEEPAYLRDLFWNFKIGSDLWIRIPKPHEIGLWASALGRLIASSRGDKNSFSKQGVMDYGTSVYKNILPFDEEDLLGPFTTYISTLMNRDLFRDRPIVPAHEAELELDRRKGKERASRLSKWLAKPLGLVGGADPRKIDFMIHGQFGGIGRIATGASDLFRGEGHDNLKFIKSASGLLVSSPAWTSRSVQKVMEQARKKGKTSSQRYATMIWMLRTSSEAETMEERDDWANAAREFAAVTRFEIEEGLWDLPGPDDNPDATMREIIDERAYDISYDLPYKQWDLSRNALDFYKEMIAPLKREISRTTQDRVFRDELKDELKARNEWYWDERDRAPTPRKDRR